MLKLLLYKVVLIIMLCFPVPYINGFLFLNKNKICENAFINEENSIKKEIIVKATFYNADLRQTDERSLETASGKIIDTIALKKGKLKWIALSRCFLKPFGGKIKYGDSVTIKNAGKLNGKYMVVDCMANKYNKNVDILIDKNKNHKYGSKNKALLIF